MSKSLLTDLLSIGVILLSFVVPTSYAPFLLFGGLFALSGAITNQLAIHMLFERVPFLYGSGVIPARFDSFKRAIKNLMMEEFFTREQLEAFFASEEKKISGGMLGMFGGESALEGLREPFSEKMKRAVVGIVNSQAFNDTLQTHLQHSSLNEDLLTSIESVIDTRLNQLTPQMVKTIVQNLIQEHLGWLVVWGGVFGGAIGVLSALLL